MFFVEEELGCQGSIKADLEWFRNIGYIIAFDAPGATCSWSCGGTRLFDKQFYKDYLLKLEEFFVSISYNSHSYTDIMNLRMNTSLACVNIGCGYYDYHTQYDYCIVEEMDRAVQIGLYLIKLLGHKEYVIPLVHYLGIDVVHHFSQINITFFIVGTV